MDKKDTPMTYLEWLKIQLVHGNPEVTNDFRELYRTKALVPDQYKDEFDLKYLSALRDEVLSYGSFEEGINALAAGMALSIIPNLDGKTHINCYSKAATKLGRALSNFAPLGFNHPEFGKCASVEGLYYFLATGKIHHYLKELSGFKAKEEGRKHERVEEDEFLEQIKEAITMKITQNEKLKEAFKNSSLPFTHYYFYTSGKSIPKIVRMDSDRWMLDHLEALRTKLKSLS